MRKIIGLLAVMMMASVGLSAADVADSLTPTAYKTWDADLGEWVGTLGHYPDETAEKNITFNFEQSVQGSGYFMTYKYARMGALAVKDYVHGSGSIDNEMEMFAQEMDRNSHPYDDTWIDENLSCISIKEDNTMVYSPMTISIGTGYYMANPLAMDSLLKEKTWVKNYRSVTSMHHEVEYAHGIDKELNILAKEKYYHEYDPIFEGVGYTQMSVNEHVDDGKVHFGVLQGSSDAAAYQSINAFPWSNAVKSALYNPAIEIDEDYFGTYDIVKNMTLEVPYKLVQKNYDWLPCCSGGWDDMLPSDKKGFGSSANGIFDCSCYKVPTEAEFQRVY